jgi:hypothetical protein
MPESEPRGVELLAGGLGVADHPIILLTLLREIIDTGAQSDIRFLARELRAGG